MSDFARLEDKLAKLRQRERISGEGRKLRGSTPEALLSALVTEIDETILPRRLSFIVEGGATVHLAVANRRLQALVSPGPDVNGADVGTLADKPLADPDDPGVGGLRDVLLKVFDGEPVVAIRSARPAGGGFPSDVGIPANILARAWGIDGTSDEAPSPDAVLTRFLSELGDDAIAWLRIEGEDVTAQGGKASAVEALGDQAAVFLDGYFGKFETIFPEAGDACAIYVGPVAGTGPAALFVEIGELSAFIAANAERAPELVSRWQKMTGA